MIALRDRYIGTLWGLHIGDAIWAPYETRSAAEIPALIGWRGLRFRRYLNPWPKDNNGRYLPAGRPTDDSDQAADLCFSLRQCEGIDQVHLRESLRNSVVGGVSRLWNGTATGAGRTTKAMLGDDEEKKAATILNPVPSNGSLMRSAPMALWLGPAPRGYPHPHGNDYQMVRRMSEVTHTHQDAINACWLYVRMLRNMLADRDFIDVESTNEFDVRVLSYVSSVLNGGGLPKDPGSFKNGWGGAEYTLKVALHAVLTTDSFEQCIRKVGLAGGDTDTYGAVAGAMAGALYGMQAIPRNWRNTILGKEVMYRYAMDLYCIKMVEDI